MNKKIITYLLAFFTIFTVYNTLIPFTFDVSFSEIGEHLRRISLTPYFVEGKRVSLTDIVGNIILFMPFGFLMYMFLYYRKTRAKLLLAIAAGALLSFSIETAQLFIISRDTAIHDLINNTLGTVIGALVAAIFARHISAFLRKIFYDILAHKPLLLIVVFALLAQAFSAVMPFTVSISVSSLFKSVKETNLAPFAYKPIGQLFFDDYSNASQFRINQAALDGLAKAGVSPEILEKLATLKDGTIQPRRRFLKTLQSVIGSKKTKQYRDIILRNTMVNSQESQFDWMQLVENILFWLAVGYVLMLTFQIYFADDPRWRIRLWTFPVIYFIALEAFQLIITSRVTDINDIIGGCAGVYLGYLLYRLIPPRENDLQSPGAVLFKIPIFIYLIFIFFAGFSPFDWSVAYIGKDMRIEALIPFYAYFQKTNLWNIYDLATSFAYFLPVSAWLAFWQKQKGTPYPHIFLLTTLAGLFCGGLIEFTQLLSLSRIAEITDVLAYGGGGALGTFLVYYLEKHVLPTLELMKKEDSRFEKVTSSPDK